MDFLRSKARSAWVTVKKCVVREHQAQPRGKQLLAKPESTCTSQKSTVSCNESRAMVLFMQISSPACQAFKMHELKEDFKEYFISVARMKTGLDAKSTALL